MRRLHAKKRPWLTELPYLADRATRLGGLLNLSRKHDKIKMRAYMERRVTSPTWGPTPPCKQALNRTATEEKSKLTFDPLYSQMSRR